jgi:hypothetical protein
VALKSDQETLRQVEAILDHLATAPLDEPWPLEGDPASWLVEGVQDALALLRGEEDG